MKKILTLVTILMLCFSTMGSTNKTTVKKIVLTEGNHFTVTSVFTEKLLEDFARKVITYDKKEMLIYFDSPGGSVFALSRILGIMESSDIKFVCVARFAASAAFSMFQACDERYILYDGVIMQHNAAGGFYGELPRVKSLFDAIHNVVTMLEERDAKRLGMTYDKYKVEINNNMWLSSANAMQKKAVDGIGHVTCSKELVNTEIPRTYTRCSLFGCESKVLVFSGCPLLKAPIEKPKTKIEVPDWKYTEPESQNPLDFMHVCPTYKK